MTRVGYRVLALALLSLLLAVAVVSCSQGPRTQGPVSAADSSTSAPSTEMSSASSSASSRASSTVPAGQTAELLWSQALEWIRQGPTRATAADSPVAIAYGDQANVLRIVVSADAREPMLPNAWRVGKDDFYWQTDDVTGQENLQQGQTTPTVVLHVTPTMAVETDEATDFHGPEGADGVTVIQMIRLLGDPYRLLFICEPSGEPERLADSNWLLTAQTTTVDVLGADLQTARDYNRVLGTTADTDIKVTLEVTPQGVPVKTAVTLGDNPLAAYDWSRVEEAPTLPGSSVEFDVWARQRAEQGGYRTIAEAAKESKFPLYWLGDSYQGTVLRLVHMETEAALLEYDLVRTATTGSAPTTTSAPTTSSLTPTRSTDGTVSPRGYILFEYSASDVPESEKPFAAKKTLIESTGEGDQAYSVYKTAKGAPGHSVLVRRGDTYISVDGVGASGDITDKLLAVAAALQRAEP